MHRSLQHAPPRVGCGQHRSHPLRVLRVEIFALVHVPLGLVLSVMGPLGPNLGCFLSSRPSGTCFIIARCLCHFGLYRVRFGERPAHLLAERFSLSVSLLLHATRHFLEWPAASVTSLHSSYCPSHRWRSSSMTLRAGSLRTVSSQ